MREVSLRIFQIMGTTHVESKVSLSEGDESLRPEIATHIDAIIAIVNSKKKIGGTAEINSPPANPPAPNSPSE